MIGLAFFNRIHWKFVAIYILLILLAMQVIGAYFIQALESHYVNNFTRMLDQQANLFAYSIQNYMHEYEEQEERDPYKDIDYLIAQMFNDPHVEIQVVDKNGIVISTTPDKKQIVGHRNTQIEVQRALQGARDEAIRYNPHTGHRLKILSVPIKVDNEVIGAVFIMASMEEVYQTIREINQILLTGTVIALLFTALLGVALSRTITKPIKEMQKKAKAMAKGDFSSQVKVYGNDEIGELAQTFNHLSQQLNKALEENKREERNRKEFVANVSHELRTPLTTMKSYLEALADGVLADPELGPKFLKVIQRETDRMIRLVNDLLLLSRMDTKKYPMHTQPTDIKRLLKEVVERYRVHVKQRDLQIRLNIESDLPIVELNRDHLIQVLDNLLSNAIKYSNDHGQIYLTARVEDSVLYLSIKDEGVGIPKEEQEHVFKRFYRVDKARSREMGGTGLGLAIAKEMILAMDGEIGLESEPNKGTLVWLRIPLHPDKGEDKHD